MMPQVEIRLPTMLAKLIGDTRTVSVHADSVRDALRELFNGHPQLRVHITDERGNVRPHVSVFHNASMLRGLDAPLESGDVLTILQAVSGGSICRESRATGAGSASTSDRNLFVVGGNLCLGKA